MSAEKQFWSHIEQLRSNISRTEQKMALSAKEYQILFSTIHELFGDWEAGNFVKMCACLKNGEVGTVAQGLLDLKRHGWIFKQIFTEQDKQYERAVQRGGYYDSEFNRRSFVRRRLATSKRYDENNIYEMDEARHRFVSEHSIFLTLFQKNKLPPAPRDKKGADQWRPHMDR